MQDRGYIKWAPFNAVINDKLIKNEVKKKSMECDKPILSDDQIEYMNEVIFEAYTNHLVVDLYIYKNRNIIKLNGYINNINKINKYITFNSIHIFFNQIVKVQVTN